MKTQGIANWKGPRISEEKLEAALNKMLTKGKLPGFIYLSKRTLTQLASTLPIVERVVVPSGTLPILPPENTIKTPKHPKVKPYVCYFRIDNKLPDGKFKLGPMDEKYFEFVKKHNAEKEECLSNISH